MNGNSIIGLIGNPVSHSIGQILYNRIFQDMGIDAFYLAMDVHMNVLPAFLKNSFFLKAFNVTIPHKVSIIPFLDDLDEIASQTRSVNLVIREQSRMKGYNTDYYGLDYALSFNQVEIEEKRIVIAGSGGIARTVIRYMLDHGAHRVDVLTRNAQNARRNLDIPGIGLHENIDEDYDIYVNCTPLGTLGDGDPFSTVDFRSGRTGIDLVYNPPDTPFLKRMRNAGGRTVSGLDVFIGQGLRTLELVFGIRPDSIFREYAVEALNEIRKG
ncbi:MAG: shikimate dehydrogenase [Thermoplasma acidophilum]|nr:shikimate dehydrogenase [Thermoplasma acidophilum]